MRRRNLRSEEAGRTGAESRRDFLWRMGLAGVGLAVPAAAAERAQAAACASEVIGQPPAPPLPWAAVSEPVRIALNQVGFLPAEPKRAIVTATAPPANDAFCLIDDDSTPTIRYRGRLETYAAASGAPSGGSPYCCYAHFDTFQQAGRYRLRLADGSLSPPFSIEKDLYGRLIPLTLQFFDVQQCGAALRDPRGPCHQDDGVAVGGPRAGKPIDGSGGWHDAGDFLKFVETTSYATALMLLACDLCPPLATARRPQGGTPSLLDHARVGVEWLLKMHPTPNEFYYQVGDQSDHARWRLPEQDCPQCDPQWKPRPVLFGVGANLAGRTAAAFAIAARLYAHHDRPFARRCADAAESVYTLGLKNRSALSTEPHDFYPEATWADDMAWGAAELFHLKRQPEHLQQAREFAQLAGPAHEEISVYNTHALAHYRIQALVSGADRDRLRSYLMEDADRVCSRSDNPYGLATAYTWGTAGAAAGAALNCLLYARVAGGDTTKYLNVARYNRDFILGCNAFGISNLIGAGAHYPLYPHHQIANLKQVELTGALVGGPTEAALFRGQEIRLDGGDGAMIPGPQRPPDSPDQTVVYHDSVQDYVTNEPAIDYTATFLLMAALYQSHPEQGLPG